MEDIELEVEIKGEAVARATLTTPFSYRGPRVVRRSAEDWKSLFREFNSSGLTAVEFCRMHDIPERSFHRHKANDLTQAEEKNQCITMVFGSTARVKVSPDIPVNALTKIVRMMHAQMRRVVQKT